MRIHVTIGNKNFEFRSYILITRKSARPFSTYSIIATTFENMIPMTIRKNVINVQSITQMVWSNQ